MRKMVTTRGGFVGARLTEAREARGFSRTQVAELINVSRQAVSLYEKEQRSPSIDTIDLAANQLRFPVHRFALPLTERNDMPHFFRSLAAATKAARVRARRRLDWVEHDICGYLGDFIEFPRANFPCFTLPGDPSELRFKDIEDIATLTRRHWGLANGPIGDLTLLLENNGAIIVQQALEVRTLDAFSRWNRESSRPFVVLGTDKRTAVRGRFNAAHELGHMVLHRHLPRSVVGRPEMHKLLEEQAHYFSGAFLMPAETFGAEVLRPNLNTFVLMKSRWRVAIRAMIKRARHIGLISQGDEERLFIYCAQRRWTTQEPYDDELECERPRLLERSFDLVLREGLATKAAIESAVAMYVQDIESAIGLEPGFFGNDVDNLRFPGLQLRRGN